MLSTRRRSEDVRQWFIRYETTLFKMRWDMCTREERNQLLESSHFQFQPISASERSFLAPQLKAASAGLALRQVVSNVDTDAFFKVPFELVPDLVGHRDVYLSEGWAFVPQSCLISVILADFKQELMQSLLVCAHRSYFCLISLILRQSIAKALPRMDDDDRLRPLLGNMANQYLGKDYTNSENAPIAGEVTHSDVDQVL